MLFSIITINRNNAAQLEQTIRSVLAQKNADYEYIVVDGASTDNSCEVIERYAGSMVYTVSEKDKGVYNAMNKAVAHARGEYVLFMNSGDLFADDDVLNRVAATRPSADFVVGGFVRMHKGRVVSHENIGMPMSFYVLIYRTICHQATFTRRDVLLELGGYSEDGKITADWCFLVSALMLHRKTCSVIDVEVALYDIDGMSGSKGGSERIVMEKKEFLSDNFPYLCDDYRLLHKYRRISLAGLKRFVMARIEKIIYK